MSMRNGICPNCQSTKIYYKQDFNPNNAILIWNGKGSFQPHRFVCTNCGYMMQFVHEQNFEAIETYWNSVNDALQEQSNREQPEKPKRKNDETDTPEMTDLDIAEYWELFPSKKKKRKRKNDNL